MRRKASELLVILESFKQQPQRLVGAVQALTTARPNAAQYIRRDAEIVTAWMTQGTGLRAAVDALGKMCRIYDIEHDLDYDEFDINAAKAALEELFK